MDPSELIELGDRLARSAFPLTVFAIALFMVTALLLWLMIKRTRHDLLRHHARCEWRLALVIRVAVGGLSLARAGTLDGINALEHDLDRALRGPLTPADQAEVEQLYLETSS